jgi:hypothetical protein
MFLLRFTLCLLLSFSLVELPVMQAQASMISTNEAMQVMNRGQNATNVANFLARSDVQQQLQHLGVNPQEASMRLSGLTDQEVAQLSQDIERASAGGDITGILVVVLIVVAIIFFAKRI